MRPMRNLDPLICPHCPWTTPAFRRAHDGVGVSNLARLREHVTTHEASNELAVTTEQVQVERKLGGFTLCSDATRFWPAPRRHL